MKPKYMVVTAAASILVLGACSDNGGSGPLLSADEADRQVFATKADGSEFDSLLEALQEGPVYARRVTSAGVDENSTDDGLVYTLNQNDFSVQVNSLGDREIAVTINGEEVILTQADERDDFSWRIETIVPGSSEDSSFVSVFLFGSSIDELYDNEGPRYLTRFGYFYDESFADDVNINGIAVVGTETRESELDDRGDAVATYSGRANLQVRQQGARFDEFDAFVNANIAMTADFGADTIAGTGDVTRVREEASGEDFDPEGGLVFEETAIQGNAFSGDLNPDADLLTSAPELSAVIGSSTYSGAFYGPNAEEIGGVASGSAVVGEDEFLMWGSFQGEEVLAPE